MEAGPDWPVDAADVVGQWTVVVVAAAADVAIAADEFAAAVGSGFAEAPAGATAVEDAVGGRFHPASAARSG